MGAPETCSQMEQKLLQQESKAPSHSKMITFFSNHVIAHTQVIFSPLPRTSGSGSTCLSTWQVMPGSLLTSSPAWSSKPSHAEPWHPTLGKRTGCTDNKHTQACQQLLTKREKGAGVNLERPEFQRLEQRVAGAHSQSGNADITPAKSSSCFPRSSSVRGSAGWHLSKPQPRSSSDQSAHSNYQSWIR